jgi:hypothetical protein
MEVYKKLFHLSRALEGTQELNRHCSKENILGTILAHNAMHGEGLQKTQWNVECSIGH